MDKDRIRDFVSASAPVERAPSLRSVNGIGARLIGTILLPGTTLYIAGVWFTFFYVPLFPEGFYIVSGNYPEYRFHRRTYYNAISELTGSDVARRFIATSYGGSVVVAVLVFFMFYIVSLVFHSR
jgi:hypothetical protein